MSEQLYALLREMQAILGKIDVQDVRTEADLSMLIVKIDRYIAADAEKCP